ncbi:MAG: DUF3298 domain-containing protein [Sphingobacteriia bacterium]|nr:DUF3298 domain-containing protein [Sphingobacteriia bacterium]
MKLIFLALFYIFINSAFAHEFNYKIISDKKNLLSKPNKEVCNENNIPSAFLTLNNECICKEDVEYPEFDIIKHPSLKEFNKIISDYIKKNEVCLKEGEVAERDVKFKIEGYKDIISVLLQERTYSGGAHGYNATTTFNFDIKAQKLVELKDVIAEENYSKLNDLLWDQIIKNKDSYFYDYERSSDKKLQLLPANNTKELVNYQFFLTKNNIVISFNPYAIAPYYAGVIEIKLPMNLLLKKYK